MAERHGVLAISPVIVDANALISDVYHLLQTDHSRLIETAELGSIRLFSPAAVYSEVYRNLRRLAVGSRSAQLHRAIDLWEAKYLPLIRWCLIDARGPSDAWSESVVHLADRPLARLAWAIAPCHIWSDNHAHLGGLTGGRNWRVLAKAADHAALPDKGAVALTIPTGLTVEGVGAGVRFLAGRPKIGIPVGIGLGAASLFGLLYLLSDRGSQVRTRLGTMVQEVVEAVGPHIEAYRRGQDYLRDSRLVRPDADSIDVVLGHTLAVSPRPLIASELVAAVEYSRGKKLSSRSVSSFLRSSSIFRRNGRRGWTVGYLARPLARSKASIGDA